MVDPVSAGAFRYRCEGFIRRPPIGRIDEALGESDVETDGCGDADLNGADPTGRTGPWQSQKRSVGGRPRPRRSASSVPRRSGCCARRIRCAWTNCTPRPRSSRKHANAATSASWLNHRRYGLRLVTSSPQLHTRPIRSNNRPISRRSGPPVTRSILVRRSAFTRRVGSLRSSHSVRSPRSMRRPSSQERWLASVNWTPRAPSRKSQGNGSSATTCLMNSAH